MMFTKNVVKRMLSKFLCLGLLLSLINLPLNVEAISGSSGNLVLGKAYSDALGSSVDGNHVGMSAVDGSISTQWLIAPTATTGTLTINLGNATTFSNVVISDYNNTVTAFTIEYFSGSAWAFAYKGGTTIGLDKALALTSAVTGTKVRLNITTNGGGGISEFEVYNGGANKATVSVSSTLLSRKSPKYLGYSSGGNLTELSNGSGWMKYGAGNTMRVWYAPSGLINATENISNDPANIATVTDFDARKAILRTNPDSSTNINWTNIEVTMEPYKYNLIEYKKFGITPLISMNYTTFSVTGTWQEYWDCWKVSYAEAFYFAKNCDSNVFQSSNEPEFVVPDTFSVATYVKYLQVQSDAVRCAVSDVNRIFNKNIVVQFVAPVLASSSSSTLAKEAMKANRTDYHGNTINYNITDWFDRHKYSFYHDDYATEINSVNSMVSSNTPNKTTLPITFSEWNWSTTGRWQDPANSIYNSDSPKVFCNTAGTLSAVMSKGVYGMYLFKHWAVFYGASNRIGYQWSTDRDESKNIIKGKPTTVSSFTTGFEGSKAVDGDIRDTSAWKTPSNSVGPQSLEVDLQGDYSIAYASIQLGKIGGAGTTEVPSDISLQYFDGTNWVAIIANSANIAAGANFLSAKLDPAVTTNKIRCISTISGSLVVREIYVSDGTAGTYIGGMTKNAEVNRMFATGFKDQRDLYTTTTTDSNIGVATSFDPISNNYYMWISEAENVNDLYTTLDLNGLQVCEGTQVTVREVSAQNFGEIPYILSIDKNLTVKVNVPKQSALLVTIPKGLAPLQKTDLTPAEDTMASIGNNINMNFKSNPLGNWYVRQNSATPSNNYVTYLKFNTGSVNPANIQRAVLELRGWKVSTTPTVPFSIHAFGLDNDSWSVSSLTGNTAPNLNRNCAFITDGGKSAWPIGVLTFLGAADYSRIDVTDYVKNHPNSLVTIALVKDKRSEDEVNDSDYVNLNTSTNSDVSFRPKLKLWYTDTVLPCTLSNLSFTSNAGTGTITVDLKNNTADAKTVNVIYAVYKANKLVGIKISPQSLSASETKPLTYPMPIMQGTAWDKIKTFVFDTPVANVKSLAQNATYVKSV